MKFKQIKNKIMNFKEIKNKEQYLKEHYIYRGVPKLTDKMNCIHCGKDFIVGDYKVEVDDENNEYIVCPNAPECDGNVMDWIRLDEK